MAMFRKRHMFRTRGAGWKLGLARVRLQSCPKEVARRAGLAAEVHSRCAGQATVEMALVLVVILFPLTVGLIALAELAWTYHALVTLTRQGAHYAATHCWQDEAGSNVVAWMQANAPPFLDRPNLGSTVQITVKYWTNDLTDPTNPVVSEFSCAGSNTPSCVPDAVTVGITGYQFRQLLPAIGLQPIQVPSFSTTVEVESAGGDPETGTCNPESGT